MVIASGTTYEFREINHLSSSEQTGMTTKGFFRLFDCARELNKECNLRSYLCAMYGNA